MFKGLVQEVIHRYKYNHAAWFEPFLVDLLGRAALPALQAAVSQAGIDLSREVLIYGNAGEDVLVGGAFGDRIDGGNDRDLVFGDNVALDRRAGDGFANAGLRRDAAADARAVRCGPAPIPGCAGRSDPPPGSPCPPPAPTRR